jgi:dTMP kinase
MAGIFISFEGIDGAGKSTHIERLAQSFAAQGRAVTLSREPGGTDLAERLRSMLLKDPMDPITEALLAFAARRDHLTQVILPALQRAEVVLCDRFTDATFAYQGGGRGVDWGLLQTLERWVQTQDGLLVQTAGPLVQPDMTLWFDLPASVAAKRLQGARVPDKFESQPEAFFRAVSQGYARRCAEGQGRFARINADQPADQVWEGVLDAVRRRGFLA